MSLIILFSPVLGFLCPADILQHTPTLANYMKQSLNRDGNLVCIIFCGSARILCKYLLENYHFFSLFKKKQLTRNIKLTVTRNRLKWQTAILKLCAGCALAADLSSKSMTNSINVTKQLARLVHFSRPTRFTVRLSTAA